MRRVSFAGKMLFNGAVLVVPIVLLAIVLHLQIQGDVDFATRERIGTAYVSSLRPLLFDLETIQLAGDPERKRSASARVDGDLATAERFDGGSAAALGAGIGRRLDALARAWHARHDAAAIAPSVLALGSEISDDSKITLDPILDGYYVGDTMINDVPSVLDGVARAGDLGATMLAAHRATVAQRIALTIFSGQIADGDRRIAHNVPIAVAAAPYAGPRLDVPTLAARRSTATFLTRLHRDVLEPALPKGSARAFRGRAEVAFARASDLYDATVAAMDDVLRRRIDALVARERLIFAIVASLTASAALTTILVARSLARRLGAVTSAIKTIVNDDMTHLVEIANSLSRGDVPDRALVRRPPLDDSGSDEASVLARSYNALSERLADVNGDLVSMTTMLSTRAFHDELTGLANRALFMDRVTQTVARNRRRIGHVAAVLFLDLDRFKLVNDSLGHLAGDMLLVAVARRLEHCLREGDTLARLGGDEFTFLLEDVAGEADAIAFANRILERLAAPFELSDRTAFATASIGIALAHDAHDAAEDVVRDADIAMYRSKALGKNRCTVFAPEFLVQASGLLQLENDLKIALERREFVLYYQPIVSLATRQLCGFEALVRWQHPQRGLLPPGDFIAAAEENGTILAIGSQIFAQACEQARTWRDSYPSAPALPISVNVSARQFAQPRTLEEIKDALARYDLDPGDIHVEVTESAIMANVEVAIGMLTELRAMGVEIHLDDFGTGYSSLGYLQRFPVNTIKIDRSFISASGGRLCNVEIVGTIVALARSLGMTTTAEGIETPEQLDRLREIGCTYGQGYHLSRPLDAASATAFIARSREDALELSGSAAGGVERVA